MVRISREDNQGHSPCGFSSLPAGKERRWLPAMRLKVSETATSDGDSYPVFWRIRAQQISGAFRLRQDGIAAKGLGVRNSPIGARVHVP